MIIEHVTWKDRIFSGKFFCREKKSKASATKLFNFYRVRGHTIGQDTRVAVEKDKERRISIYKYKPLEQFQLLFVLPPPLLLDADSSCEYSPHGFLFDHPLPFFFFLPSIVSLDSVIIFPPTHGFCTRSKAISTILYYFLIVFLSFLSFYIERGEKVDKYKGLIWDSVLIVNKHLWIWFSIV